MANISRRFFVGLLGAELANITFGRQTQGHSLGRIATGGQCEQITIPGRKLPPAPDQPPESDEFTRLADFPGTIYSLPVKVQADDMLPAFHYMQWRAYERRRPSFASDLQTIAAGSDKAAIDSVADWKHMLSRAGRMHDRFAQAQTVFDWICKNIAPDYDAPARTKAALDKRMDEWRTLPDVLRTRKGVCIDQTLLMMEGLLELGFDPRSFKAEMMLDQVSNGGLATVKETGMHAVLGLHLNGRRLVFDLTDRIGIWLENGYYPASGHGQEYKTPFLAVGYDESYGYGARVRRGNPLVIDTLDPVRFTLSPHDQRLYDTIASLSPAADSSQEIPLQINQAERPWTVLKEPRVRKPAVLSP